MINKVGNNAIAKNPIRRRLLRQVAFLLIANRLSCSLLSRADLSTAEDVFLFHYVSVSDLSSRP